MLIYSHSHILTYWLKRTPLRQVLEIIAENKAVEEELRRQRKREEAARQARESQQRKQRKFEEQQRKQRYSGGYQQGYGGHAGNGGGHSYGGAGSGSSRRSRGSSNGSKTYGGESNSSGKVCHYASLGVSSTSSDAEIKKGYRYVPISVILIFYSLHFPSPPSPARALFS